jgi:hypothetical protein
VNDFKKILDDYIQARYGSASSQQEQLIEVR